MLWSVADDVAHHKRRYVRGELEGKLMRNGFKPVFSTSYASLLLPLMMLNRRKAKDASALSDINRETEVGGVLNSLLTIILRIEVAASLAGVRWPAGGSCVVVARAI